MSKDYVLLTVPPADSKHVPIYVAITAENDGEMCYGWEQVFREYGADMLDVSNVKLRGGVAPWSRRRQ